MLVNTSITIYHKTLDVATKLEQWTRYNIADAWIFDRVGASVSKGYSNANSVEVRIPYGLIDISSIDIGDILVKGTTTLDISTQSDLKGYKVYNVVSIKDNNFGSVPHIHLSGD